MSPAMKIASPNSVPFMIHMIAYFENYINSGAKKDELNRLPHHGIFSKLIKMLSLKFG